MRIFTAPFADTDYVFLHTEIDLSHSAAMLSLRKTKSFVFHG